MLENKYLDSKIKTSYRDASTDLTPTICVSNYKGYANIYL